MLISGTAYGGSQVVASWVVVAGSRSAVDVGLLFALRLAPLIVVGPVAGAMADRSSPGRLLAWTNLLAFGTYGVLSGAALIPGASVPAIWLAMVVLGSLDAVRLATTGLLVADAAQATTASGPIAISQVAARIGAGVGGLGFGLILAIKGPAVAFGVAAILAAVAAQLLLRLDVPASIRRSDDRLRGAVRDGLALIVRNRRVRLLAAVAVVAEILGFSNDGLLPVFAQQVLGLGPSGLGLLYLAVRIGGLVGLAALVRFGSRLDGRAIVALLAVFGLALAGFATSTWVATSLALLAVAGSAAACIDVLEQSLMQRSVAGAERGRAMGVWTICLGFGPLGFIALGALASVAGAATAQLLAGAAMASIGLALALLPGVSGDLRGVRPAPVARPGLQPP